VELASKAKLKVLLLANYELDAQASMLAFSKLMSDELKTRGCEVKVIQPPACAGKFRLLGRGFSKWLAYLDKYVLFLPELLSEKKWADVVHICDHSNGVYVPYIKDVPHVVTCHDLLAVRAGLGEDTNCPLSPVGWILQRWILSGLRQANSVACDSTNTLLDAERLLGRVNGRKITLIPLGLNNSFSILPKSETDKTLKNVAGLNYEVPYVLHVGSSQPRKNREGIIKAFSLIKDKFTGQCVFAGSPLNGSQRQLASDLGVADRIVEIVGCTGKTLEALYNRAFVFVFPSYTEGFGWPIHEAQASGCPVIASSVEPCPESAGKGAIICQPDDFDGIAQSILNLNDEDRKRLIALGSENLKRFTAKAMTDSYLQLYESAISS
jgi:glycosyltransferase involved in cell wall biosynthesis